MADTNDSAYQRALISRMVKWTSPGGDVLVAGPNTKRVGLILGSSAQGRAVYAFGAPGADNFGIYVPQNGQPVVLYRRDLGSLIEQEIHVWASANPTNGAVFEVMEP